MVIKCPNCNHYISDTATICPRCGIRVNGTNTSFGSEVDKQEQTPTEKDTLADTPVGSINPYDKKYERTEENEVAEEKNKKSKIWTLILIGLLGGIIGAVVLYFGISHNENNADHGDDEYVLTGRKVFHGEVDVYPITMELQIEGERIKGWLYYDRYGPENKLYLSGSLRGKGILLDETDANGKFTGFFSGSYSDGVIEGEYKNLKKVMPFTLTELY